jgi:phosphoserine phosphatase
LAAAAVAASDIVSGRSNLMRSYRLVLISSADDPALEPSLVRDACRVLPEGQRQEPLWLSEGEACEIGFRIEDEREDLLATLAGNIGREVIGSRRIDVAVIPDEYRRKKLLVADMESTIIEQECLDELAEDVGLRARISDITTRAMRGEIDFEAAVKERVGLLKGLEASALDKLYTDRITLAPGAQALVRTMKKNGAWCALVSGGFTFFTERIAERLGFDTHQANTLEIRDGRLTGRVVEPILGREAKLAALQRLAAERAVRAEETLAVGDGANDLDMIKAAGLGVAYRAKPLVAAQARAAIQYGDLTALLYLQGYRRDEFVD